MFKPTTLSSKTLELQLLPYGLTFHSLVVRDPASSESLELLVGPTDPTEHHYSKGRAFNNQTVGRYANRLPSGRTEKDGMVMQLEGDDGVCLHSGKAGFDTLEWTFTSRADSTLFPASDFLYPPASSEAIFSLTSAAGDQGFPLTLLIEALVTVSEPDEEDGEKSLGSVCYVLRSKVLEEGTVDSKAGTPVNLTVHWGFNMNADGKGKGKVADHKLWVNSWNVPEVDEKKLPTGNLSCTVPGKPSEALDFHKGDLEDPSSHRLVGDKPPPGGIDHNFILNGAPPSIPQVILTSPDSHYSLRFRTNQSTAQIYADPNHAVFVEFQHPLATFLHQELERVAGESTILKEGEVYENMASVEVVRL